MHNFDFDNILRFLRIRRKLLDSPYTESGLFLHFCAIFCMPRIRRTDVNSPYTEILLIGKISDFFKSSVYGESCWILRIRSVGFFHIFAQFYVSSVYVGRIWTLRIRRFCEGGNFRFFHLLRIRGYEFSTPVYGETESWPVNNCQDRRTSRSQIDTVLLYSFFGQQLLKG